MSIPPAPNIGSSPRHMMRRLRELGFRGAWFGALARTGLYRRLILIQVPLEEIPVTQEQATGVEVRDLEEKDLDAYRVFRPEEAFHEALGRLRAGHRCASAWQDGRLVSVMWTATDRVSIPYLDLELVLAPGDVYAYDSFTAPALRGRDMASFAGSALRKRVRESGAGRLLGAIVPENRRARRRAEKRGHRFIGLMRSWRLGPWRRFSIKTEPGLFPPLGLALPGPTAQDSRRLVHG